MSIVAPQESQTSPVPLGLHLQDTSGQKQLYVRDAPRDATVAELLTDVAEELQLPGIDSEGWPIVYQARLEREGRHLNASELLEEAVLPGDRLVITPSIDAGSV